MNTLEPKSKVNLAHLTNNNFFFWSPAATAAGSTINSFQNICSTLNAFKWIRFWNKAVCYCRHCRYFHSCRWYLSKIYYCHHCRLKCLPLHCFAVRDTPENMVQCINSFGIRGSGIWFCAAKFYHAHL